MTDRKPLLSICIPTYNRAEYLAKCLSSIVLQDAFNPNEVEIVISDNASNDNTIAVVKKYQNQYENIYYSRNAENIFDKKFPTVINNAHGIYRKLSNDTMIYENGSIGYLLDIIKQNINEKPILLFLNRSKHGKIYRGESFDKFCKILSYWVTWSALSGIWEDDFNMLEDKFDGWQLNFWHVKVTFESFEHKNKYLIVDKKFFTVQDIQKKDLSYSPFRVFFVNFLGMYQKYIHNNSLHIETFEYIKKRLLFEYFAGMLEQFTYTPEKFIITENEKMDYLLDLYKNEKYIRIFPFYFKYRLFIRQIKNMVKKLLNKKRY